MGIALRQSFEKKYTHRIRIPHFVLSKYRDIEKITPSIEGIEDISDGLDSMFFLAKQEKFNSKDIMYDTCQSYNLGRHIQRRIEKHLRKKNISTESRVSVVGQTDHWEDGSTFYNHDLYLDLILPNDELAQKIIKNFQKITKIDVLDHIFGLKAEALPKDSEIWSGYSQYYLPQINNSWILQKN